VEAKELAKTSANKNLRHWEVRERIGSPARSFCANCVFVEMQGRSMNGEDNIAGRRGRNR
jgi:hypothetical protein